MNNHGQSGGIPDADIDADSAWLVTMGDTCVRVAVLDNGFDLHHGDLDTLTTMIHQYDVTGERWWDPVPDSDAGIDSLCYYDSVNCGHGTCCLGELAAAHKGEKDLKGLAPRCTYWAIKAFSDGGTCIVDNLRHALRFAWRNAGCQVISISIGVPEQAAMNAQLDSAYQRGVSVFCAAGNRGFVSYPASESTVVAVGATNDSDQVWNYSGKGWQLDLLAPSGDTSRAGIWTWDIMGQRGYISTVYPASACANSNNYNCKFNGTSAAAPIAAGVLALVLSRRPDLAGNALLDRTILYRSAEKKDTALWTWANGRVNAYRALLSVIRGDINNSGHIDSPDLPALASYCFKVGPPPTLDRRVADTDCDGDADICDYLRTLAASLAGTAIDTCFKF